MSEKEKESKEAVKWRSQSEMESWAPLLPCVQVKDCFIFWDEVSFMIRLLQVRDGQ